MRNTAGLFVLFGLCYLCDAYVKDLNDFDDTGHIAKRQLAALFTEFRKIIESVPYIPDNIVNDKCIHDESNVEMGDVRECGETVLKDYMHTIVRYDVFRDQGKKREFYKHFKEYMQFMRGHKAFGLDDVIPGAGTYNSMMKIEQENREPPQPFESIEWTTAKMSADY